MRHKNRANNVILPGELAFIPGSELIYFDELGKAWRFLLWWEKLIMLCGNACFTLDPGCRRTGVIDPKAAVNQQNFRPLAEAVLCHEETLAAQQ